MSSETTYTCDGCGESIRPITGYTSEAFLELRNAWKGHVGNHVFSTVGYQGVDRVKHFHDERCLITYCLRGISRKEAERVRGLLDGSAAARLDRA